MLTRKQHEKREYDILAPYAMKSRETLSREYSEKEHDYRGVYQRDKDRIVYSTAFRRLQYKTQVFVNYEGDYYRTRLTHTLEVGQIARTIARMLRLNEELVEAIAMAHDLGHTPFGHAGEDALAEIMQDHGGFDHNSHGLRVVSVLEKKYPHFPGLNLTYEVREGIAKHSTRFDRKVEYPGIDKNGMPSIEAQIVDLSDEIAYDNHDLDDGLASGLIFEKDLRDISYWREVERMVKKQYPSIKDDVKNYQIVKTMINLQVTDVIDNTARTIKKNKIKHLSDARDFGAKVATFSEKMQLKRKPIRTFLMDKLYRHYRVVRMSDKAMRFMKSLFDVYLNKPGQLPQATFARLEREDKYVVICDYIAGMTDRYALDEYKKLFEPYERV